MPTQQSLTPRFDQQMLGAVIHGARLQPWRWVVMAYLLLSSAFRAVLLATMGSALDPTVGTVALTLLVGFGWDVLAASILFVPLLVTLAVMPQRWRRYRLGRLVLYAGMAGWVMLLLFITVAEWIFWDEFQTRFNFIAVDYLVYTHEVIANIWQSYPVALILTGLACLSLGVVWWQRHAIVGLGTSQRWGAETTAAFCLACIPFFAWSLVKSAPTPWFANHYMNEIDGNGVVEFFRAFNLAELDYDRFYPTLSRADAYARVRALNPPTAHSQYANTDPMGLMREVHYPAPTHALNVVLISVESLSADYLKFFGNPDGVTPNLDRLTDESLFFTNLYATGTRTVRGLEALSLSIPPTPGESIVKRPKNTGLVTIGGILAEQGYDVRFFYGGYARFDNMGEFFGGNGYQVIDRTAIPDERIHHENAWGVADEDLFTQALLEIGRSSAAGRPSYSHIMTTSNHRPYTYPDGRIDLPSGHSGRYGGVKYTDWAIGDFLARASGEAWFKDTVFVIVADHCASSAGKTALPLHRYRIPMLIYAPGRITPRKFDQLTSQIDVVPTVLGLLQVSYRAAFFGRDVLEPPTKAPYAFVSTYQELGFLRGDRLVALAPNVAPSAFATDLAQSKVSLAASDPMAHDAIALYQVAADAFRRGALRAAPTAPLAKVATAAQ
jgi:phosphoglycerol transferase MdoB-like AlkP superfamily enzyme